MELVAKNRRLVMQIRRPSIDDPISIEFEFHYYQLTENIKAIKKINEITSGELQKYLDSIKEQIKSRINRLVEKDKNEYDYYSAHLLGLHDPKLGIDTIDIDRQKVASIIRQEDNVYYAREYFPKFFRDMILVYLVILFEEYLGKLLLTYSIKKKEFHQIKKYSFPKNVVVGEYLISI